MASLPVSGILTLIALRIGLPFEVELPDEEIVKALEDSREGRNLTTHSNVSELFESWEK